MPIQNSIIFAMGPHHRPRSPRRARASLLGADRSLQIQDRGGDLRQHLPHAGRVMIEVAQPEHDPAREPVGFRDALSQSVRRAEHDALIALAEVAEERDKTAM